MSESEESREASPAPRPERMYRKGRLCVQNFSEDEILYFRVRAEDVHGEQVDLATVRFPDFSVNRSAYSDPEDVIYGLTGWVVACFEVKHIPGPIQFEPNKNWFSFRAEHDPVDDKGEENYSHTEVRTHKDQLDKTIRCLDRRLKPPKLVQMEFRQALTDFAYYHNK